MKPLFRSAAACLLLTGAACSHESPARPAEPPPALPAATAVARAEDLPDAIVLTGTVQPASRVVLAAKVMGRIRGIAVKEGDAINAGQVLVRIDDADLAAAVAQAEAAVAAASAAEENAARHRDRMRELEGRQAATRKNREDAETAHAVASAQRRQAESALAGARAMIAFATLTSPIAGVVAAKHADVGSLAVPGAPILTLEETSRVKVEAALPETEAGAAAAGTPVEVAFDAGGIAPRRAAVSEVLPSADPATRTFLARVVLDNADGALRSGSFARVRVERGRRSALRVPRSALVERGALTGLFVVAREEGVPTARLRWIRAGRGDGDAVEVLGGLAAGETYVTAPPPWAADGFRIVEGR
jgi:RND family efflux transporter MFP subunit